MHSRREVWVHLGLALAVFLCSVSAQGDACANCGPNQQCDVVSNVAKCSCKDGFQLDKDNKSCIDIDECSSKTSTCDTNAECTNTKGSFTCSCNIGFAGDGQTCTDIKPYESEMKVYLKNLNIDHCKGSGCQHRCVNTLFTYKCVCNTKYRLAGDGKTCLSHDRWRVEYTALITIAVFLLMILFVTCCLCARYKRLQENICCKSFVSWACCMTGCFCKCNKGVAAETTDLYYHQVKINISPYPERKTLTTADGE